MLIVAEQRLVPSHTNEAIIVPPPIEDVSAHVGGGSLDLDDRGLFPQYGAYFRILIGIHRKLHIVTDLIRGLSPHHNPSATIVRVTRFLQGGNGCRHVRHNNRLLTEVLYYFDRRFNR